MPNRARLIILTYEGAELLDVSGPTSVFAAANRIAGRALYEIIVASPGGGPVEHGCGTVLMTAGLGALAADAFDTVLVVGAESVPLRAAMASDRLGDYLREANGKAFRLGSICTGAFVLAAAGVLAGRTVATHWIASSRFSRLFSDVRCDGEALYVNDDKLWTSAGVTTGIDMALAMLERDHGTALKAEVARRLVVYSHRPGHQSQFSTLLAAQANEDLRFSGLCAWLRKSTATAVSVEQMAEHVAMSPRSFHRHFTRTFGRTPAKFFETLRLDAARELLEANVSIAKAAGGAGFRSEAAFRSAFKAAFGVTPQLYRETWRKL